jgi:hypothetical protein
MKATIIYRDPLENPIYEYRGVKFQRVIGFNGHSSEWMEVEQKTAANGGATYFDSIRLLGYTKQEAMEKISEETARLPQQRTVRVDSNDSLDWETVKNGMTLVIEDVPFKASVSKGRKMLIHELEFKREDMPMRQSKKYAGMSHPRVHYHCKMIMDTGSIVETISRFRYPSESYDLPNGGTTSNKWDLYK